MDDALNDATATLARVREVVGREASVAAVAALLVGYLAVTSWDTWSQEDCPLCRAGVPIETAR